VRSKRFRAGLIATFPKDVPDPLAAQATKADAAALFTPRNSGPAPNPRSSSQSLIAYLAPSGTYASQSLQPLATEDSEFVLVLLVMGAIKVHAL
jgi:hypothetical protein